MSFDLQVLGGDLVISSTGDLATVSGGSKLEQDLVKIAMTPLGANPLQPWYGSLVSKTLIGSYLNSSIIFTMAQTQLTSAVENLQTLQNMQVASGQQVTPDEQIASITNILINRSKQDLRLISVTIQVLSKAFGQVSTTFTVSNT
jgi:hypothetical protein